MGFRPILLIESIFPAPGSEAAAAAEALRVEVEAARAEAEAAAGAAAALGDAMATCSEVAELRAELVAVAAGLEGFEKVPETLNPNPLKRFEKVPETPTPKPLSLNLTTVARLSLTSAFRRGSAGAV